MSLEEILRILNSRPSNIGVTDIGWVRTLVSPKTFNFLIKANHLKYMFSGKYIRISDEALRIISNKDSNDILEAYLNF